MKLEGRLTLLFDDAGMEITIEDELSSTSFVKARLDAKATCQVLSRLACVNCELDVQGLDHIGKRMEHKSFEFEIPHPGYSMNKDDICTLALSVCPAGWESDLYFGSQNSFFERDGKEFARMRIRRWVSVE